MKDREAVRRSILTQTPDPKIQILAQIQHLESDQYDLTTSQKQDLEVGDDKLRSVHLIERALDKFTDEFHPQQGCGRKIKIYPKAPRISPQRRLKIRRRDRSNKSEPKTYRGRGEEKEESPRTSPARSSPLRASPPAFTKTPSSSPKKTSPKAAITFRSSTFPLMTDVDTSGMEWRSRGSRVNTAHMVKPRVGGIRSLILDVDFSFQYP